MNWLAIAKLLLVLAAFFARRADRADIESGALSLLEDAQRKRVVAAKDARDAVLDGTVPEDPADPNRRD